MSFLIQHAFAGMWGFVWQWGLCSGAMILLVAASFYFTSLRKDLLWAAFGLAVFMGGNFNGAKLADARCAAQAQVVSKTVDKAVAKAHTSKAKDRWDNPSN